MRRMPLRQYINRIRSFWSVCVFLKKRMQFPARVTTERMIAGKIYVTMRYRSATLFRIKEREKRGTANKNTIGNSFSEIHYASSEESQEWSLSFIPSASLFKVPIRFLHCVCVCVYMYVHVCTRACAFN